MLKIQHRINTSAELEQVPVDYGVEIDIRSDNKRLYLHHDPFTQGESFEDWLKNYKHSFLILNVKEEGLEIRILELLAEYKIKNYFFLDQSFPFIVKHANLLDRNSAIRISEFELVESALKSSSIAKWVWVDCFTIFPINSNDYKRLKEEGGFKICIVSPELQGKNNQSEITNFRANIEKLNITGDAVCTKFPHLWD